MAKDYDNLFMLGYYLLKINTITTFFQRKYIIQNKVYKILITIEKDGK